jgi:hypothetical protein
MRRVTRGLGLVLLHASSPSTGAAFEWSTASSRPNVDRRAIAGIWTLTPFSAQKFPMKEFTVYPKKEKKQDDDVPELLLILKEDGSFQQHTSEYEEENDQDLSKSWKSFQKDRQHKKEQHLQGLVKGTWDYVDGNLILAADRPEEMKYNALSDGYVHNDEDRSRGDKTKNSATTSSRKPTTDTLLKGKVVASYRTRLQDNPALGGLSNATTTTTLDTHLSVPKGSISIGKFFYPKHHPSFFEQPMFHPVKKGNFALRQVLGSLNTAQDTAVDEAASAAERFQRADFYNKTFYLTTQPIRQRLPKGEKRWSIKYNAFVYDPPSDKAKKAIEEANKRASSIRVMQVAFHRNNTFSTVAGLGNDAILRGKFDVVGGEMDQLWMQVVRFGFGRSVSGSVYSEGRMLSHEDAKVYWGTIKVEKNEQGEEEAATTSEHGHDNDDNKMMRKSENIQSGDSLTDADDPDKPKRVEVTGSVLDGWGLEPQPVARFIMKETIGDDVESLLEDDEDEEDDDDPATALDENLARLDVGMEESDGINWSEEDNSFQ